MQSSCHQWDVLCESIFFPAKGYSSSDANCLLVVVEAGKVVKIIL
jgi:hypothetical protein